MILLLAMFSIVLVKAILERLGLVVGVHRTLRNVEVSEGHAQGASYGGRRSSANRCASATAVSR